VIGSDRAAVEGYFAQVGLGTGAVIHTVAQSSPEWNARGYPHSDWVRRVRPTFPDDTMTGADIFGARDPDGRVGHGVPAIALAVATALAEHI